MKTEELLPLIVYLFTLNLGIHNVSIPTQCYDHKCVATLSFIIIINPLVGWLVGCFGFNGPLRQYFSLYRVVSQREGER